VTREHGWTDLRTAGPTGWSHAAAGEFRWAFRPPFAWLSGVAVNIVVALGWLVVEPLRGAPRQDWAILVGTYLAVWILADVTTTNVLGADADRLREHSDYSVWRVLVLKNLVLMVLVGLPTLIATAVITLMSEADHRLQVTLPRVLFTVLTWFGVGNLISVLLPVAAVPWKQRWRRRRELRSTAWWLGHLALPYGLFYAVDPINRVPPLVHRLAPYASEETWFGVLLLAAGLAVWAVGTGLAVLISRRLGIRWR
jgi:hypothetical protein